ncbi:MAG: glycosyltransferase family 2 protein [Candidatus Omnitrophica bacterium]|nr:Undecaprenyl-phosphate 4-deoxy-4-formamido-L-arabinose transferase [bacterium]NUN97005.1 glycosyltransferase family 2 protein [Candidatus Omnitrophota bacterium]
MDSGNKPANGKHPEFSVVVTCYYEEKSIDEFFSRLKRAMDSLNRSYEIIMVNDGSTDGTWEKLKGFRESDPKVTAVVDFFRNSGQQAGLTAAMCLAKGDHYIFMDSDLQLAPEEIPVLVSEFDKGYDLVSGYRKDRKDPWARLLPSKLANMIMRKASKSEFRDFGCTFKVCRGRLIRGLELGPHHLYSTVEAIANCARYTEIPVSHSPRRYGKSGWTFKKLWKYNMDNILHLSDKPFQVISGFSLLLALLFMVRILVDLFTPFHLLREVSNGLILNVLVISMLVLFAILCLVGEFTIRSFLAVERVPKYIIREIL